MGRKFITYNGVIVGNGGLTLLSTETDTPTPPSFSNVNSFSFDGVDEYFLSDSTYTELDGQSKATISAWIKVETNTDTLSYLCSIEGGSAFTIAIRLQTVTSTLCWVYVNGAGNNSRASATIGTIKNDGLWHHLVVCLDLSLPNFQECQIYLDNVAQSMNGYFAGATLPNANSGLFIGNRNSAYSGHFGGKVDELAIWSGTDLRNDVATIYNSGVPNDLNNNGLTAPTTWQRMGENATWNGATWTMLDVNGNYMNRSINMVEANRTTDVP